MMQYHFGCKFPRFLEDISGLYGTHRLLSKRRATRFVHTIVHPSYVYTWPIVEPAISTYVLSRRLPSCPTASISVIALLRGRYEHQHFWRGACDVRKDYRKRTRSTPHALQVCAPFTCAVRVHASSSLLMCLGSDVRNDYPTQSVETGEHCACCTRVIITTPAPAVGSHSLDTALIRLHCAFTDC
ncbi:hypothetical protein EXIGLDRAFT_336253 [Exidia glandulosa HHB12029]|uniref:Uncharacterized protein n=1 Tax=Exidia glandulosa HHB12029 TaxID=1314781 RepID=A0A165CLH1_EXIGL|nr:hypothetical protein EXIGLDRAFT_336253 [Exidia glandulosa HHB12029]